MTAVLEARDLVRHYSVSRGAFRPPATLKALAGVSFSLDVGRTLAVVGESGSGKSTLARLLTLIEQPTAGALLIDGEDVAHARWETAQAHAPGNPDGVPEPVRFAQSAPDDRQGAGGAPAGQHEDERVRAEGGGAGDHGEGRPSRRSTIIAIRTCSPAASGSASPSPAPWSCGPKILVLDEPVSALDVSIRAQVLNLLAGLQEEFSLAYVFVSHDLSVVRHIADDVMVIYLGHVVEMGSRDAIFTGAQHPYTRALLSATPVADPGAKRERIMLTGEPPSPIAPPPGCPVQPALSARLRPLPRRKAAGREETGAGRRLFRRRGLR